MSAAAAARRGANGGGGWLHAAWLALTGAAATPEQLLTEEEIAGDGGGGGSALPALTARNSSSHYELVSTEEPVGNETGWESTEPASEAELFLLAREEDPKTTTTTNSPESIFTCGELRMSKPEFWRWPAKKAIAGEPPESMAAVRESKPFLTRRHRGVKRVNDVEMDDHPFSFDRHGRMESSSPFLLLSSS